MVAFFKYFTLISLAIILLKGGLSGLLVTVRILLMLMLAAYFAKLIKKYLPAFMSDIYIGKRPKKALKYDLSSCRVCGWMICKCKEIKTK